MAKLSPTQQSVLDKLRDPHLRAVLGKAPTLYRVPGGFWTYRGCMSKTGAHRMGIDNDDRHSIPDWSVTIQTVRAMERAGLLRRLNVHREEWRDERGLA